MSAFFTALTLVFLAELGDKTQLIVLSHGGGRKAGRTLIALFITIGLLMALAVTVGGVIHAVVPAMIGSFTRDQVIGVIAGLIFGVFAIITWRSIGEEEEEEVTPPVSLMAFLTMFFVAELIDKSSISAATLATTAHPLWIWAGATLGEFGAVAISFVAGSALRKVVTERQMHMIGAIAFAIVGIVMVATSIVGNSA